MELAPILPSVNCLDQGQLITDNWVNGERLAVSGDSDSSEFSEFFELSEFSDYSDYPELSEFSDSPLPIIGLMG